MKPESRKSPAVDPSNRKKLTVVMKPQPKSKSSESLSKSLSKKSPVAQHLVSSVNTRSKGLTRQSGATHLTQLPKNNSNQIDTMKFTSLCHSLPVVDQCSCKIAPLSASTRKISDFPSLNPVTPKIMITKCSKLEKLVETKELGKVKKVLRSKVKSPLNKIGKIGIKDNVGKINKDKVEYETQLKRKDSEILNLNRKINAIQKIVSDKEKVIKNLELKFPKSSQT